MSSEYEYEYEYHPQSGLSTRSSRACSLLAVPRTRTQRSGTRTRTRTQRSGTRTRWLFDGYLSVMRLFIAMLGHHRPCAGGAMTGSYQRSSPKTRPLGQSPNVEEGK